MKTPPRNPAASRATTSDLSIDEALLLHSIEWEPVEMVMGAAVAAIPTMGFVGGNGWAQVTDIAAQSFSDAVAAAVARMEEDCRWAGGAGVIGVHVEFTVHRHTAEAVLVGTAVRPVGSGASGRPFVSDLSVRDFVLLHQAGWAPLGLAFGASFIQVPYRTLGTVFKQMAANTEMVNLTYAMYEAREQGMERLQAAALAIGATGVVAVQYQDRPLPFASHVIAFTAWGTAIGLSGSGHRYIAPRVVVAVDDAVNLFDVSKGLRGRD